LLSFKSHGSYAAGDSALPIRRRREPNILIIWGDDIGQFNVGTTWA
jgi:hypothetical protein